MGLNRALGELQSHFTGRHRIVPTEKWMDTELGAQVWFLAQSSFGQAGAILPVHFNDDEILVQEYPDHPGIIFFFCKRVAGRERYFSVPIAFQAETLGDLKTAGKWDDPPKNN